jgi:Transposase DDE domain
MKRRAAIEPSIGHLKLEHRLERNRLKGVAGDAINAILAVAAMNFHKLREAFWPICLRCLSQFWSRLLSVTASEAPQDQPMCA